MKRFSVLIMTLAAVLTFVSCSQPASSGSGSSDGGSASPSVTKAYVYENEFLGTWKTPSGHTLVFTETSFTNFDGKIYSMPTDPIIKTQSEYGYSWYTDNGSIEHSFADDNYTVHGYFHRTGAFYVNYEFSNLGQTLTFSNVADNVYTKQASSESGGGSVSSDFSIFSGVWNYNPTSTAGGYLSFSSDGSVKFTPKTASAVKNFTGTYTLSGTSLSLDMNNGASGNSAFSFTAKFVITATASSMKLSFVSGSSTAVGQTVTDSSSCSAITTLWGKGQDDSLTIVTLSNR